LGQHRAVPREIPSETELALAGLELPPDVRDRWVTTDDGARLHVLERGSGRPVVLLHGIACSAELWVRQLREWADGARVIAVDQRGHGLSGVGSDGFGSAPISRLAADLGAVLESLDLRDAVVIGHSMGGMATLQFAVDSRGEEAAGRVAAFGFVSTTAGPVFGVRGLAPLLGAAMPLARGYLGARDVLGAGRLLSSDTSWWVMRSCFGTRPSLAEVRFSEAMAMATSPRTVSGLLSGVASFDLSRRLGRLEVPSAVLVGTADRLTPPFHARRLARLLGDVEVAELKDCGHMPMIERPDALDELLGKLMAQSAAA
jgi:pimeloyl-ACP methyl ester carboxylesterase